MTERDPRPPVAAASFVAAAAMAAPVRPRPGGTSGWPAIQLRVLCAERGYSVHLAKHAFLAGSVGQLRLSRSFEVTVAGAKLNANYDCPG